MVCSWQCGTEWELAEKLNNSINQTNESCRSRGNFFAIIEPDLANRSTESRTER